MTFRLPQIKRFAYKHFSQLRQIKQFYDLRKSQWLTHPMLERIQEKKLRSIIKYAYKNVEYYHHLFKSLNLNPGDIQNVDDLSKIPILTKSEIQNNFEKIIANNVDWNRCFLKRTSGSTGMPLTILFDQNAHDNIGSRHLRYYFGCGLKLKDKMAYFSDPRHFYRKRSRFSYLGFLRRENFSVFDHIEDHITKLIEYSPHVIQGYPSILWLIAEMVQDKKIKGIDPRLIFSTSELLT